MEQYLTPIVLLALGALLLLYPLLHLRGILAGRPEYRGPRALFLVTWALLSGAIILGGAGALIRSLF